jgi:putative NADPH-quinone reductase
MVCRVLLVLAHPRATSLTAQVATRVRERLVAARFIVDFLDLYAEDFDPRMRPDDEPDWEDPDKEYSLEVQQHMRRIGGADHIIVIFPVWWSAPPAILKGWIERTWTHGFAYTPQGSNLTVRTMMWVGLAGTSMRDFVASGLDKHIDRQLRVEISNFCRISDARVRMIYDSVDAKEPQVLSTIWHTVEELVHEFITSAGR